MRVFRVRSGVTITLLLTLSTACARQPRRTYITYTTGAACIRRQSGLRCGGYGAGRAVIHGSRRAARTDVRSTVGQCASGAQWPRNGTDDRPDVRHRIRPARGVWPDHRCGWVPARHALLYGADPIQLAAHHSDGASLPGVFLRRFRCRGSRVPVATALVAILAPAEVRRSGTGVIRAAWPRFH